ncbi:hypothetical protein HDU97_002390 [Phlyctochytrium planicorne]|nr:hypothetical protein HDU97_002390 [Phlyctochytrium planicorne]
MSSSYLPSSTQARRHPDHGQYEFTICELPSDYTDNPGFRPVADESLDYIIEINRPRRGSTGGLMGFFPPPVPRRNDMVIIKRDSHGQQKSNLEKSSIFPTPPSPTSVIPPKSRATSKSTPARRSSLDDGKPRRRKPPAGGPMREMVDSAGKYSSSTVISPTAKFWHISSPPETRNNSLRTPPRVAFSNEVMVTVVGGGTEDAELDGGTAVIAVQKTTKSKTNNSNSSESTLPVGSSCSISIPAAPPFAFPSSSTMLAPLASLTNTNTSTLSPHPTPGDETITTPPPTTFNAPVHAQYVPGRRAHTLRNCTGGNRYRDRRFPAVKILPRIESGDHDPSSSTSGFPLWKRSRSRSHPGLGTSLHHKELEHGDRDLFESLELTHPNAIFVREDLELEAENDTDSLDAEESESQEDEEEESYEHPSRKKQDDEEEDNPFMEIAPQFIVRRFSTYSNKSTPVPVSMEDGPTAASKEADASSSTRSGGWRKKGRLGSLLYALFLWRFWRKQQK